MPKLSKTWKCAFKILIFWFEKHRMTSQKRKTNRLTCLKCNIPAFMESKNWRLKIGIDWCLLGLLNKTIRNPRVICLFLIIFFKKRRILWVALSLGSLISVPGPSDYFFLNNVPFTPPLLGTTTLFCKASSAMFRARPCVLDGRSKILCCLKTFEIIVSTYTLVPLR